MLKFIHHLFVPNHRNNHRAKILHHTSIFVLIAVLSLTFLAASFISSSRPDVLGISYSISQGELLTLVNQKRAENGLSPLSANPALEDAARRKASDMFVKNYWAHFAPDGSTSPWGFMKAAGYNYQFAGENLAKGFTGSNDVVEAWMNSPTHRENMLSDKYQEIGFAIVEGTLEGEETVLVVQLFGSTVSPRLAEVPDVEVAASAPSVQVQGESEEVDVIADPQPEQQVIKKPIIDAGTTTKAASSVALTFLAFGFILDMVVVERRKIPRVVGHNLDHIMLITMFIFFLIILKGGVIL